LEPDFMPAPYINLGFSHLYLGRLDDAVSEVDRAAERDREVPEFLLLKYFVAFLKADQAEMSRQTSRARGKRGAEDWISHAQALSLAHAGQFREAARMSRLAIELAEQAGQHERAAMFEAAIGVWSALAGDAAGAKQSAAAALGRANGRDVEYAAAFALA